MSRAGSLEVRLRKRFDELTGPHSLNNRTVHHMTRHYCFSAEANHARPRLGPLDAPIASATHTLGALTRRWFALAEAAEPCCTQHPREHHMQRFKSVTHVQRLALLHESELAHTDPDPQFLHRPMRYDIGLLSTVI